MSGGVDISRTLLYGKRQKVKTGRVGVTGVVIVYGDMVIWEVSHDEEDPIGVVLKEEFKEFEEFQIEVKNPPNDGMTYYRYRHDDARYNYGVDNEGWHRLDNIYHREKAA